MSMLQRRTDAEVLDEIRELYDLAALPGINDEAARIAAYVIEWAVGLTDLPPAVALLTASQAQRVANPHRGGDM